MKRRLFTSLAAATAVAASILISSGAAAAAPDATIPTTATTASALTVGVTPNAKLPDAIRVDETQFKIVSLLRGAGKQVYDCTGGTYTFREPIAGLFTSRGVPAGIHGKGPFWTNLDGSHVDGSAAVPAASPDPTRNVPWLKLVATSTPNTTGAFSNLAFIQRIDTRGGVAPAGPCTAPDTKAVDYTANYVFWAHK